MWARLFPTTLFPVCFQLVGPQEALAWELDGRSEAAAYSTCGGLVQFLLAHLLAVGQQSGPQPGLQLLHPPQDLPQACLIRRPGAYIYMCEDGHQLLLQGTHIIKAEGDERLRGDPGHLRGSQLVLGGSNVSSVSHTLQPSSLPDCLSCRLQAPTLDA